MDHLTVHLHEIIWMLSMRAYRFVPSQACYACSLVNNVVSEPRKLSCDSVSIILPPSLNVHKYRPHFAVLLGLLLS